MSSFFQLLEGSFTSQVSHEVDGLIFQPCGVSHHPCLAACHLSTHKLNVFCWFFSLWASTWVSDSLSLPAAICHFLHQGLSLCHCRVKPHSYYLHIHGALCETLNQIYGGLCYGSGLDGNSDLLCFRTAENHFYLLTVMLLHCSSTAMDPGAYISLCNTWINLHNISERRSWSEFFAYYPLLYLLSFIVLAWC